MRRVDALLVVCAVAGAAVCLAATACAPPAWRAAVAPGPSPVERLAAADTLVRAGCDDCLTAAFREYDALRSTAAVADAATAGAARSATLLAIRERELGTEDGGHLVRARALAASPWMLQLVEIADTLPTRGGGRQVSDDVELVRMQTAYRNRAAWMDALRLHADEDPLSAYVWMSFKCAYEPTGQQAIDEWIAAAPSWRDTPLLAFKAAICSGYSRSAFDAVLAMEPRFTELHYFISLSAAFAGKIDEAMEHLLAAFAWRARWPAVTNSLAADYIALEDFDKAIEFYDRTLAVWPASPDAQLGKAKAQTYATRYADAIATIDQLLVQERWFIGEARYWRALNENQLDRLDAAWDDVELAARLMRNAAVPKLAGIVSYRRHQLDVARAKFEESNKLDPADCETSFYLGIVLGEQGAWARTAEVLTATTACLDTAEKKLLAEIAAIHPSANHPEREARQIQKREQDIAKGRRMRATSWFNLAVSYYSLSRSDEARAYAEKVVDDEQFGVRARDLISRLR